MVPWIINCAMSFFEKNSSPKECTRLKNEAKKAAVFEGFFNFLSFASLPGNKALKPSGFCILNALSFFENPTAFLEQHNAIHLNLDNDKAEIKRLFMPKV